MEHQQFRLAIPIKLYQSAMQSVLTLIFALALFKLAQWFLLFESFEPKIVKIIFYVILLAISLILLFFALSLLLRPRPILEISRYRIIHFHFFSKKQQRVVAQFKDIHSLNLDYSVIKDMKHWYVNMVLHNGQTVKMPLNKLYYEQKLLNEKQIFDIIEQIHQGIIPPVLYQIEMDIHDKMTNTGIWLNVLGIGALLYFFITEFIF